MNYFHQSLGHKIQKFIARNVVELGDMEHIPTL